MDKLRQWFRGVRSGFQAWAFTRVVVYGFGYLKHQHVGQQLNQATDQKFGKDKADAVQKELAVWLRQVANELET